MAGLTAIKRKGFAGGGRDASTTSFSKSYDSQSVAAGLGDPKTRERANTTVDRQQREGQNQADRDNQAIANRAAIREQIKRQELEKINYVKQNPFKKTFDVAGSVFDFGKNYIRNRAKGLYNIVPNNPERELQFLSSLRISNPAKYNSLPQNLKNVLEATDQDFAPSYKDSSKFSYDDFESLRNFDDGAFAKYALDRGSPGLSVAGDMSKVGMKSVRKDQFGNPVKDMFGNMLFDYGDPTFEGGGGSQNLLPINYGMGVAPVEEEKETQTFAFDPSRFGPGGNAADVTRASYIFNQGGRVPRNMGGIMNVVPRQGYFLGKIVKGVGKAIGSVADAAGKVLKSDLGKAALLAAGAYYAPTMFGGTTGFGAGSTYGNFAKGLMSPNLIGPMTKAGSLGRTISNFAINNKALTAGILGIGASAFMPTKVDQLPGGGDRGGRLIDPLTGEEGTPSSMRANIENAKIEADGDPVKLAAIDQKYNNMLNLVDNRPYKNYALYANGGRIRAEEGGLMNLGGMEKDYRAEGGFVPIGKQEKADDVPARLSVNEFVFTADAVRNAGGGDIDKGAEVMENMMKNLENGGRVSEESQGNSGAQDMFSVSERIGEVI